MTILNFLNQRSRRLGILDWKMAQGAAMCITLIAAKLFPRVLEINVWVLVTVTIILYIRPLYLFYFDSSR